MSGCFIVFAKNECPSCNNAKNWFEKNNCQYIITYCIDSGKNNNKTLVSEIVLQDMKKLLQQYNPNEKSNPFKTWPKIFFQKHNGELIFIGGYSDLIKNEFIEKLLKTK